MKSVVLSILGGSFVVAASIFGASTKADPMNFPIALGLGLLAAIYCFSAHQSIGRD